MKVGDHAICTMGSNKDKRFIIKALLKNEGWYSCQLESRDNQRYYQYHESHLQSVK